MAGTSRGRRVRIMRVPGDEAQHALAAEARGQAIDQRADLLFAGGAAVEACLRRGERFGMQHGEADEVEAEAGVERIGHGFHALAIEANDRFRRPRRAAGLDDHGAHHAVHAEEAGLEHAPALAARLEHRRRSPRAGRRRPLRSPPSG